METKYNHLNVEKDKYDFWLKGGFFSSGDLTKTPYSIVIAPPNVTGKLHLGHAWDTTLSDIIVRRKRMQGFDVLWLPGMDHAGIATQAKVDQKLKNQGISRYDLGREKYLDVAWEWKEEYAQHIRNQWAAVGISVDYNKERFTLDKGLNNAVNEVFIKLYKKGLIYRGERIISWDPEAKTALSNIEVEHKEVEGAFYYFKYEYTDNSGAIEIATTRPETMFGDTAIMVHPDDERYTSVVGKKVYIPGTKTSIPIIADDYVDIEFGSGAVKVTPAHDPNDFQVGLRHKLAMPLCMNDDGTMNSMAFKYEGMDRFKCRKQLCEDLKDIGLCTKVEKLLHNVGHSERTGAVVEPRLSKQWFVEMKPLANNALKKNTVDFVPPRFKKIFVQWMEKIEDWCISRQLWWGHRIPAWYKGDEIYVGEEPPKGDGWVRDEDVLDTWFSSALWPFTTFGWPEKTDDLERYYPTDCLITAYDIIFFWVSRMIFQAIEFTGNSPFKDVLIHGLIRDKDGRKMSKSLGNGIDPMDIKEKYGMDSLRYFLTTNSAPGQDLRFETEKVESSWNYINKIWNISRYTLSNLGDFTNKDIHFNIELFDLSDKWIMSRFNTVLKDFDMHCDKYDFGEAAKGLYNFIWHDFASWYVEVSKITLTGDNEELINIKKSCLLSLLDSVLKLLHPFMPFVTEEIYQLIPHECESIMISDWPLLNKRFDFKDGDSFSVITEIISKVRNVRQEYNVKNAKPIDLIIKCENNDIVNILNEEIDVLKRFTNPKDLNISTNIVENINECITIVLNKVSIYLPLGSLVNKDEEIERLSNELIKVESEITRATNMLANKNFTNKAPADKVKAEKTKLEKYKENMKEIMKSIEVLKK